MSYRRLYLYLLLCSTLLMGWLWWLSLKKDHRFVRSSGVPDRSFSAGLYQSTISFTLIYPTGQRALLSCNIRDFPPPNFRSGREFVGGFDFHFPLHPKGAEAMHFLYFPVWLPWLVFVTVGYGLIRFLEQRSAGVAEMRLASQKSAGERP